MAGSIKKMPAIVTLAITLLLGVLQVVNMEANLGLDPRTKNYIQLALFFGAALGFKALAGGLFAAALKLPQWATTVIAAVIGAVGFLVTSDTGMSAGLKDVLVVGLSVLAHLGFGPAGEPLSAPPPPHRAKSAHKPAAR